MKLDVKFVTNLKIKEAVKEVDKATKQGLKNVVVDIANDVIHESPIITGHNRRSIAYKIGSKVKALGKPKGGEKPFTDFDPGELRENEGAIYSTSGYGGFLETGTVKMAAQPYFKPALDRNIKNLPKDIKAELQ